MRIAKEWGYQYWDGDRNNGFGGYKYDGRYKSAAETIALHYGLNENDTVLDIGCGKGSLLRELNEIFGIVPYGLDISEYAYEDAFFHGEFRIGDCKRLPYASKSFDFTYSINTFHNLGYKDLKQAIREMVRVSKDKSYICVESYRNEEELCNLQCWALTCQSFYKPDDWLQIYEDCGYKGDYEFIYFT